MFARTSAELVSASYLAPQSECGEENKEAKDAELGTRLWAWAVEEIRNKSLLK